MANQKREQGLARTLARALSQEPELSPGVLKFAKDNPEILLYLLEDHERNIGELSNKVTELKEEVRAQKEFREGENRGFNKRQSITSNKFLLASILIGLGSFTVAIGSLAVAIWALASGDG